MQLRRCHRVRERLQRNSPDHDVPLELSEAHELPNGEPKPRISDGRW